MDESRTSVGSASFAERFWLAALLLLVLITRIPFLDMGFGRSDAWRVGVTGKFWVEQGKYEPSRPPGFPLTEIASAASYSIFRGSPLTWIATNSITCLFFLIAVVGVWALARRSGVRNPLILATIYAFVPLNWVYSVETIDYLWMTSLLILAVLAMDAPGRWSPVWAGIFLGLAASARFSAGLMLIPMLILMRAGGRPWRDLLASLIAFVLVVFGFYLVVILSIKDVKSYSDWFNYLNRTASGLAEVEGGTLARRFLMPATQLFGPLATIAFALAGLWGLPSLVRLLKKGDRGVWVAGLMSFFIMVPYLWHLHPNYWIPAIGFLLILLARTVRLGMVVLVGVLIVAANFPLWQAGVECLGGTAILTPSRHLETIASQVAPYQNETVFAETEVRLNLWDTVKELLDHDLPSNWVIMATLRLPLIEFLVPDCRRIPLPLANGKTTSVWGSPSGGARYVYLLSPGQVAAVVESGYHAVYLPGMESMYYAENRVRIQDVPGVEVLYYDSNGAR